MVLGWKGRRSLGMRVTAGAALAATLVGPLRMTYAIAAPGASTSGTPQGSAASPPSTKLPTDVPWALATAIRPARVKVVAGSVDEAGIWRIFDGRAATGMEPAGAPVRFRAELLGATYLDAVAVFGKAAGALSVESEGPSGTTALLQKAALAGGGDRWNRRDFSKAPLATAVVVTFEPSAPNALLPELELWGRPASAPSSADGVTLPDALYAGVPAGARELRAPESEQTISPATISRPGVGGTFTVDVDGDPAGIDRAFLVYELSGLPHFTAAARSINGERALGRFGASRAKGGLQLEEIPVASLRAGQNRIQFLPADERSPESYRVSQLRVIAIPRAGTRLTDASARDAAPLRDGSEATGWRAPASKPADSRRWEFSSATQPWALDFRLPGKGYGTLTVASGNARDNGRIAVALDGLAAGWHRVPLDKLPATEALTLTLAAGKEEAAAISELAIEGSPLPADEAPRIAVTYPLSGECVNHRVHVRGFVTPGAESIHTDGRRIDGSIGRDGAFGFELPEKEAAGRDVLVEAVYPGGARARRTVSVGRCIERPPLVVADDGRPRQPVEDAGAPYGVTVRAGQAASLSFAGVKLDIPAGAVDKDVRLTVRPIPAKQVAPLDPGMTNISPEAQVFRLGPHGMVFRKPIQVTLPYAKKLIPTGYTEGDVRTFYYSEDLHRWEQVGLLAQNDGEMVSVTEHFTDFVNATLAMPEHPGTQSLNPTSLKDIKLADPAAGIARIAPPAASSSGAAQVTFPIETPPGRRGIQPSVALTYSNEGGNSWLGLGWDLKAPSIEIDTRFGVPRYDGHETYLLNGEMLTPTGGGFYRKRAENTFDIIQRLGSDTSSYSWKVTDKNGTVYIYGSSSDPQDLKVSRLFDPDPESGHIFRWYLETVTDVFGNRMTYGYRRYLGNGSEVQVHLDQISYTSNVNTGLAAAYNVRFWPDDALDRNDAFTTGRPGFLVGTHKFLRRIDVSLNNAMFRRYFFTYTTGAFGRMLLSSISMIGPDGTTKLYTYNLGYYPLPVEESVEATPLKHFERPVVWGTLRELAATGTVARVEDGMSLSEADLSGINANVGMQVGPFSFHVGGGLTGGSDTGHMRMIDMNGDGLPDFVDDTNGINLNTLILTPTNTNRFNILTSDNVFVPLTHTNRSGWNLEGDLGASFKSQVGSIGPGGGATLALGYARTSTEEERVLADLDGDGFTDIVRINDHPTGPADTGQVIYNHNNNGLGFDSASTGAGITTSTRSVTVTAWDQAKPQGVFPVDTVSRWIAPYDGHVTITGSILKKDTINGGDGVNAGIWIARGTSPACKLWGADITNASPACTPSNPFNICVPVQFPCDGSSPPQVTVTAGDRIYVVVDPKNDSDNDVITWNPTITYDQFSANPNLREPYGAPIYKFSQQDDFRTAGLPWLMWRANADGFVRLTLTHNKKQTSDNVNVRLIKNPSSDPMAIGGQEVLNIPLLADDSVASPVTLGFDPPLAVQKGDRFLLQVLSDAPIDPAKVGIGPATLTYTYFIRERGRDRNGVQRPPVQGPVEYITHPKTGAVLGARVQGDTMRMSLDAVRRPISPYYPPHKLIPFGPPPLGGPTKSFLSPGGSLTIVGTASKPFTPGQHHPDAVVLIQGVNKLYKKGTVTDQGGADMATTIASTAAGEQIFFTILSKDAGKEADNVQWAPMVNSQPVSVNKFYIDADFNAAASGHQPDPFSDGYHNWYVGDFDASQAFSEGLLKFPNFPFHRNRDSFMFCYPFNGEDGAAPHYQCRGTNAYIAAGEQSPSFSATGMGNDAQRRALRLAETANVNVSDDFRITVAGAGAGASAGIGVGSTRSTLDFMDMNGDRIPDSVALGGILYGDGQGGFVNTSPSDPSLPFLRFTSSRNVRSSIDVGAGDIGQLLNIQTPEGQPRTVASTKVGAGVDYGFTSSSAELEDVNGDGLPDLLIQSANDPSTATVRYNLGYKFAPGVSWPNTAWTNADFDSISSLSGFSAFLGADVGPQALSVSDTGANNASFGEGVEIPDGSGSVSASGGTGDVQSTTRTLTRLLDVNGDGLVDQIMKKPGDPIMWVKINMGTKFAPQQPWRLLVWSDPSNPNQTLPLAPPPEFYYPASFGFLENGDAAAYSVEEGWQFSLAFEICFFFCVGFSGFTGGQDGWSQMDFVDIDGDGHPDHVLKRKGDPNVYAKLSVIGATDMLKTITGPLGDTIEIEYARAGNYVDQNLGVDMPSNHWVLSSVRTGDGRGNFHKDHISYYLYAPTDATKASIPSGFYDRKEREDYGFGHVEITRGQFANGAWQEGDGSQVERFFYNQDFYRRGRLKAEFELDASGNLFRGRKIGVLDPPTPNPQPNVDDSSIRTGFFFPNAEDAYALFYEKQATFLAIATELAQTGPAAPKSLHEGRLWDARGNLISYIDYGDPPSGLTRIDYTITWPDPEPDTHIDRPTEILATLGPTNPMLRRRKIAYIPGKGVPGVVTNFITGGGVPGSGTPGTTYTDASSSYVFDYDAYGNVLTYSDPTTYALKYTYDTVAQTYVTRVDDLSFGYSSTANYDFRFGVPVSSTDISGQVESYAYDQFGRLCSVRGPDDQSTAVDPTIAMSYGIIPSSCPNAPAAGAAFPAYAVTRHKDVQHAGDPIDTVTFIDGFGRVIQTKKDLDRDPTGNGPVTTGMTVSGQVLFDTRGRVASQAQPSFSTATTTTFGASNVSNPSTFTYDVLGRQTSMNVPDGTAQGIQTTTSYSIVTPTGADNLGDSRSWLLTEVKDGIANRVPAPPANTGRRLTYSDARGNRVAVREYDQIGTSTSLTALTTKYAYDPLNQLVTVTDAKGNVTSAVYDTVGKLVSLTNPDAGRTDYRFDLNGNLKEKQTAVLRGASQTIKYAYDFNRLKLIDYPTSPDVSYVYGGPTEGGNTAGNLAGRVKQVTFDNGSELRFYDSLGNVRETRTTLNRMSTTTGLPPSITFNMKYTYDWLGRMQSMTFPNWIDTNYNFIAGEGEKVSYSYDHGGNIDKITGAHQTPNPQQTSHPLTFTYLSHVGYNEFEQRTVLTSGNGIANNYLYEPTTRRLSDVNADSRPAGQPTTPFHRLHYTYDKVGNVTHMVNNLSVRPYLNAPVFVGPLDVTYTYDNLYQLRGMSQKYRGNVAYGYQSSDSYTFDEIGNIKTKAQSQDRLVWDNQTVNQNDTNPVVTQLASSRFDHNVGALTYNLSYTYPAARPHGATPVSETPAGVPTGDRTYTYDANGNNTGNTFKGDVRGQTWDEENRLKQVTRNTGTLAQFRYDDTGERTKKSTPTGGDTWYVNQYFVMLPGARPTKHIFAGETRVATKTDAINMQTPLQHYYHPDHLGTTSYVTDKSQNMVQHERYFAYGELWRQGTEQEEANPSDRRDWLFTSKEWDSDTSLYYFGARYFDPHADVWQSTDPILASYIRGTPNGGVLAPGNLGLYTYSWNNPVVLKDPNGLYGNDGTDGAPEGGHQIELHPPETRTRRMTHDELNNLWDGMAASMGRQPRNDELFDAAARAYPDTTMAPITEQVNLKILKYKAVVHAVVGVAGGEAIMGGAGAGTLAPDVEEGLVFYRGTSLGEAMEAVDAQGLNASRIAANQRLAPPMSGPGAYLSTQLVTAAHYAGYAGIQGRALGPAVLRIGVSGVRFNRFALRCNICVETPIPRPPFLGATETRIPFEHLTEFNGMARFSIHQ